MAVSSSISAIGARMADFDLPIANPDGDSVAKPNRSLEDYADAKAVVIVFTCNHCPYAKHIWSELSRISADYSARGVRIVAINPNDALRYPDDSFARMKDEAAKRALPFPYLHDESQEVARAYEAVCTPDIYLLGSNRRLAYRGRLDATRPGSGDANGEDLRGALDELLSSGVVSRMQHASMGCSIKWKS